MLFLVNVAATVKVFVSVMDCIDFVFYGWQQTVHSILLTNKIFRFFVEAVTGIPVALSIVEML